MKYIFAICLSFYSWYGHAQQDPAKNGINFLKLDSWQAATTRAENENKLIFIDFYTTWCIPCREMAEKVLSKSEVGEFFNANFINLSIQLDTAKTDNTYIKKWYKDANFLKSTFRINSFPTYLFVNSKGEIVHSIETNFDKKIFIERAKAALNPETQNVFLQREYNKGKRDTAFLSLLIKSSQSSRDYDLITKYTNDYLLSQSDLFTKENLIRIGRTTSHSADVGFAVLLKHPEKVDSLFGKGYSKRQISLIVFDEEILPIVRINGKKKVYGPLMYGYEGEPNKNVDWRSITQNIERKYPDFANSILFDAKLNHYRATNNWGDYCNEIDNYIAKNRNEADIQFLNRHANTILMVCEDKKYMPRALLWSKQAIDMHNPPQPNVLYNYSGLLYNSGKKSLAITTMKEAIKQSGGKNPDYEKALKEMESGDW
ncbi:thioredoxin family protein [Pedobacter kyungheensis]|uniref:thioredoxin family protein n=1 Tax=Pedobacter kyungheensis TaxID=1069985 RepID=UPI00068A50BA|nr:thioredoxin fold domain-containing protein [Pedobacter kyungheensis]